MCGEPEQPVCLFPAIHLTQRCLPPFALDSAHVCLSHHALYHLFQLLLHV